MDRKFVQDKADKLNEMTRKVTLARQTVLAMPDNQNKQAKLAKIDEISNQVDLAKRAEMAELEKLNNPPRVLKKRRLLKVTYDSDFD